MDTIKSDADRYPRIRLRREYDENGSHNVLSVSMGPDVSETPNGFSEMYDSEGGGWKRLTSSAVRNEDLETLVKEYVLGPEFIRRSPGDLKAEFLKKIANPSSFSIKDANKFGIKLIDKYYKFIPEDIVRIVNRLSSSDNYDDLDETIRALSVQFKKKVYNKWKNDRHKPSIKGNTLIGVIVDQKKNGQPSDWKFKVKSRQSFYEDNMADSIQKNQFSDLAKMLYREITNAKWENLFFRDSQDHDVFNKKWAQYPKIGYFGIVYLLAKYIDESKVIGGPGFSGRSILQAFKSDRKKYSSLQNFLIKSKKEYPINTANLISAEEIKHILDNLENKQ